ncbi:hypothetical protein Tco_0598286 [Tanacetum coccineum]
MVRFAEPVISSSTSQKQLGVSKSTKSSRSKSTDNKKNDRTQQISSRTQKKNKVKDHSGIIKSSLNKKNCVEPSGSKSKSVKKTKRKEEWKPTGKVFTKIGYVWRPIRRTFTLIGNVCPLARITATNKVPLREPIPLKVVTQESVVTKVYTRRPNVPKTNGSNSKLKIAKSMISNIMEPGTSRGSNTSVTPSSSSIDLRHGLVRGLPRLKFGKDRLCSTCSMGKSKKQSHKPKSEDTNQEKLYLLQHAKSFLGNQSLGLGAWDEEEEVALKIEFYCPSVKYLFIYELYVTNLNRIMSSITTQQTKLDLEIANNLFTPIRLGLSLVYPRPIWISPPLEYPLVDTPMVEKSKLDEDTQGKAVDPTHYRGMYSKDSAIALTAFVDTDHAGCQDTRRSTSGSMQLLGDKLVSWSSKRQKSAAISNTEAEYIALSGCLENGVVKLYFVKMEYQLANIFTKALCRERIEFLIDKLGMRSFTPETLKELADEAEE